MEKNKKRQTKDQISDDTQISTQRKTCSFLFLRPTPLGFRQIVQHVRLHVVEMSE